MFSSIELCVLFIVVVNNSFVFIRSFSFVKNEISASVNKYHMVIDTARSSDNENVQLLDTLSKFYSFLGAGDQSTYIGKILKKSVDSTQQLIASSNQGVRIEISFPESKKNDISVVESLDINKNVAHKNILFNCWPTKIYN